jgi:small-conductance mechanosensitive channel
METAAEDGILNRRNLFAFDSYVNLILGPAFMVLSARLGPWMSSRPYLPPYGYLVIGLIMFMYGIWQRYTLSRKEIRRSAWLFATIMAAIPVVVLVLALVFLPLFLRPVSESLLWVSIIYMSMLVTVYTLGGRRA